MAVATCGRCDGSGSLTWTNVANGVCFACKGRGKVSYNVQKAIVEMGDDMIAKCEWIIRSKPEAYAKLSYAKLEVIRNFAHSYVMNRTAKLVYGNQVFDAWFDNGEKAFQAAQNAKLAMAR